MSVFATTRDKDNEKSSSAESSSALKSSTIWLNLLSADFTVLASSAALTGWYSYGIVLSGRDAYVWQISAIADS